MCYIHLSLLGIPAEIYQQNALTQETLDVWYTPFYILDLWKYRLSHRRVNQGDRNVEDDNNAVAASDFEQIEEIESITGDEVQEQLSLFDI